MRRRILTFDVTSILKWDVGRALNSDVLPWRIPAVLLWAALGWLVASILLGISVPLAVRRGWELPQWTPLFVIVASVSAFVRIGRRRG